MACSLVTGVWVWDGGVGAGWGCGGGMGVWGWDGGVGAGWGCGGVWGAGGKSATGAQVNATEAFLTYSWKRTILGFIISVKRRLKGTASIKMREIDPSHVKEISFICSLVITKTACSFRAFDSTDRLHSLSLCLSRDHLWNVDKGFRSA